MRDGMGRPEPDAEDMFSTRMAATAALAVAIGMGMAGGAAAQDPAQNPAQGQADTLRGKRAGDFLIGLSAIGVLPTNGGRVDLIGGTPTASNSATGQLDFTYFFTDMVAVNLIAATTRHDVSVRDSAIGTVSLGHVWALPPTLTVQFHPMPRQRFSPYLGLGVNFTAFYGEGGRPSAPVTNVKIDNSWGMAINFGTDVEIAPNWLANFDVKKIFFLEPDVRVDTSVGRINARADINPWVIGAGIRYRF